MLDDDVIQRILGTALRTGGELRRGLRRGQGQLQRHPRRRQGRGAELRPRPRAPASGSSSATPPASPTPPTSPRPACAEAAEAAGAAARSAAAAWCEVALTRQDAPRPNDVAVLPEDVAKAAKVELLRRADDAARGAGSADQPGDGPLRRQPPPDPRRQQRRPARRGRPGPHAVLGAWRWPRATPACRPATSRSAARSASSCSTASTSRTSPARPPSGRSPSWPPARRPSGTMPVVIGPGGGGVLFHEACGHGLEADLVGKGASVFAGPDGRAGRRPAASPSSTTARWPRSGAASPSTTRARRAQRNVLIEDGILTDYMWDLLRSRKEGRAALGQRPPPELPAPADGADDEHLPAGRPRRARRHHRRHRPTACTWPSSAAARSTPPPATSCSA